MNPGESIGGCVPDALPLTRWNVYGLESGVPVNMSRRSVAAASY